MGRVDGFVNAKINTFELGEFGQMSKAEQTAHVNNKMMQKMVKPHLDKAVQQINKNAKAMEGKSKK